MHHIHPGSRHLRPAPICIMHPGFPVATTWAPVSRIASTLSRLICPPSSGWVIP